MMFGKGYVITEIIKITAITLRNLEGTLYSPLIHSDFWCEVRNIKQVLVFPVTLTVFLYPLLTRTTGWSSPVRYNQLMHTNSLIAKKNLYLVDNVSRAYMYSRDLALQ